MKLSSTGHKASLTRAQLQARYTKEAKALLQRAVDNLKRAQRETRRQLTLSAPKLRSLCRGSVKRARARGRAGVAAALEKSRAEARALVENARRGCSRRREKELRAAGKHLQALELEAQRAKERYMAERLGGALERQSRTLRRSTAKERAQESDDEVRRNLPPDLVPVFNAIKGKVRAAPGKSRTEEFEQWVEENADEVAALLAARAELEVEELTSQLSKRDKTLRAMLRRAVVTPKDLKALNISCDDVELLGLSCDSPEDIEATVATLSQPRRRSRGGSAPF